MSAEEFDEWNIYFEIKNEREEPKKPQSKPERLSMGKQR